MSNIQLDKENKPKRNIISTEDINRSNNDDSSEFFDDLNATLIDDLDKSFEKMEQQKIDDEVKEVEKSKKIKNIMTLSIVIAVALVVLIVIIMIVLSSLNKANYTLNLIDSGVIVEQSVKFEDTSNKFLAGANTASGDDTTETTNELDKYNIVTLDSNNTFKSGDTVLIDVVVNTKESNEESFSDHDTQLFFTYKASTVGYDKVIKTVEQYNKDSVNKITLPDKATYDNSSMDLAMFSFEVAYPSNFPTYNSDGKVFVIPTMSMNIVGKCEELLADDNNLANSLDKYIVIGEMVYDLGNMIDISIPVGAEINKAKTIEYNFIVTLPFNTKKELYETKATLSVQDKEYVFNVDNTDTTVVEIKEEVEEPVEEGAEAPVATEEPMDEQ